MKFHDVIKQHAANMPEHLAIQGDGISLNYQALQGHIENTQTQLAQYCATYTTALAVDNGPAWAVLDIAAMAEKNPLVPLPSFFSDAQFKHAIQDAGISMIVTDQPARFTALFKDSTQITFDLSIDEKKLTLIELNVEPASTKLPDSTAKITYTSGTTGQPKGVCLSANNMQQVAESITEAVQLTPQDQHLCILPLATLLENVAGLYATLLAGGTAHILPSNQVGFKGSAFDIEHLYQALKKSHATTAILIPELLSALVNFIEGGAAPLTSLRFLAVGGASVAPSLIKRALAVGLPVFEGYGLSESASVVALNTPAANKVGSVGKVLPHLQIKLNDNHEIFVKGANYLGYINQANTDEGWLDTGDIGYLDDAQFLFITGRKKNIFITSFGRNVSPEWVERDLTSTTAIQQACLFGESKPWNTALILTTQNTTPASINAAISQINASLPDYAQVGQYLLATEPFSVSNNQLTPNGRLKRNEIWKIYQPVIDALYTAS
jgi:long-subunit acyl-CoA synthetase (AMP-forming)